MFEDESESLSKDVDRKRRSIVHRGVGDVGEGDVGGTRDDVGVRRGKRRKVYLPFKGVEESWKRARGDPTRRRTILVEKEGDVTSGLVHGLSWGQRREGEPGKGQDKTGDGDRNGPPNPNPNRGSSPPLPPRNGRRGSRTELVNVLVHPTEVPSSSTTPVTPVSSSRPPRQEGSPPGRQLPEEGPPPSPESDGKTVVVDGDTRSRRTTRVGARDLEGPTSPTSPPYTSTVRSQPVGRGPPSYPNCNTFPTNV
ncbi:Hypothetical predicted protein [Marmota monax]|uniref:Uncharacterized protein n=1 Tax=Marmota monax TaxID=9995 RepID=A0A5E4AS12_MARMO|nr:Hypothetical predicted protein [Marmota monax]